MTVVTNNIQLGSSLTATQNFTVTAESADGTMKLARGNAGATTQDILTVDASGNITPGGNLLGGVIGTGQTWQDVLPGRTSGTTYTNTTGKPIMVCTTAGLSSTSQHHINVSGMLIAQYVTNNTTGGAHSTLTVIVPNGATYSVTADAGSILYWRELR